MEPRPGREHPTGGTFWDSHVKIRWTFLLAALKKFSQKMAMAIIAVHRNLEKANFVRKLRREEGKIVKANGGVLKLRFNPGMS